MEHILKSKWFISPLRLPWRKVMFFIYKILSIGDHMWVRGGGMCPLLPAPGSHLVQTLAGPVHAATVSVDLHGGSKTNNRKQISNTDIAPVDFIMEFFPLFLDISIVICTFYLLLYVIHLLTPVLIVTRLDLRYWLFLVMDLNSQGQFHHIVCYFLLIFI